jgi:hypothetical protein
MIIGYEQINSDGYLVDIEAGIYDSFEEADAKYEELKTTYADDASVIGVFKASRKRGHKYSKIEGESV